MIAQIIDQQEFVKKTLDRIEETIQNYPHLNKAYEFSIFGIPVVKFAVEKGTNNIAYNLTERYVEG